MSIKELATYDMDRDYYHNLEAGPRFQGEIPPWTPNPTHTFLGYRVNSTLGIPAGLLLDSKWIDLYARLGYDILVYKTVRSRQYPVHPWPNCLFVKTDMLQPHSLPAKVLAPRDWEPSSPRRVTITNSFGMPSLPPQGWQEDVEKALGYLREGQILVVSGVGTLEDSREKLVQDFVKVASMIKETGAPVVELNFSCPNTAEGEGTIYTDSELASWIAREVSRALAGTPLLIKVGLLLGDQLKETLKALAPWIQGVVGINSVSLPVVNEEGKPALGAGRETSGVCGWAIRRCGQAFVEEALILREKEKYDLAICGCGGVTQPHHIREYLNLGAQAVFTCTGAMFNPYLALEYKGVVEAHETPT